MKHKILAGFLLIALVFCGIALSNLQKNNDVFSSQELMASALSAKDVSTLQNIEWVSCEDTDDGIDATHFGQVRIVYNNNSKTHTKTLEDRSQTNDGEHGIAEMSCEGNVPSVSFISCETAREGVCKKEVAEAETAINVSEKTESSMSASVEISEFEEDFGTKLTVQAEDPYLSVFKRIYYKITITNTGTEASDATASFGSSYPNSLSSFHHSLCPASAKCKVTNNYKTIEIKDLAPGQSHIVRYSRSFSLRESGIITEKVDVENGQTDVAVLVVKGGKGPMKSKKATKDTELGKNVIEKKNCLQDIGDNPDTDKIKKCLLSKTYGRDISLEGIKYDFEARKMLFKICRTKNAIDTDPLKYIMKIGLVISSDDPTIYETSGTLEFSDDKAGCQWTGGYDFPTGSRFQESRNSYWVAAEIDAENLLEEKNEKNNIRLEQLFLDTRSNKFVNEDSPNIKILDLEVVPGIQKIKNKTFIYNSTNTAHALHLRANVENIGAHDLPLSYYSNTDKQDVYTFLSTYFYCSETGGAREIITPSTDFLRKYLDYFYGYHDGIKKYRGFSEQITIPGKSTKKVNLFILLDEKSEWEDEKIHENDDDIELSCAIQVNPTNGTWDRIWSRTSRSYHFELLRKNNEWRIENLFLKQDVYTVEKPDTEKFTPGDTFAEDHLTEILDTYK